MKGANGFALGLGVVITSTAAIGLGNGGEALSLSGPPHAAREALRARIERNHEVARARCAALAGTARDRCFIAAHADLGAALMEGAEPYATRRGQAGANAVSG
jgi:hypothetical protein